MYTFQSKTFLIAALVVFCISNTNAQERPRIVIGLVVDQMTNDYVNRFYDDFGDDGFKKLINGGTYFPNTFFDYVPTATGPGHASIYTGTTTNWNLNIIWFPAYLLSF